MSTILIVTKRGLGIRMSVKDFPIQKRGGVGIRAVTLRRTDSDGEDEVVGVIPILDEEEGEK